MVKKTYFVLRQPGDGQFATDKLRLFAISLYEKFLQPFADDINAAPCSHRKHVFKTAEDLLRAVPNTPLEIVFDERADKAAFEELELETSTNENVEFEKKCSEMKKFIRKARTELVHKDRFERLVLNSLYGWIDSFHTTIADPEKFHNNKVEWLRLFNEQNVEMQVSKPSH